MNRGSIQISKTGSDEVLADVPFSQALTDLARVRLTNAGNTAVLERGNGNTEAFGLFVGYTAARLARVEDLPDIDPADVTYERMLELATGWDFLLTLPETEDKPGKGEALDENPTVTPAEPSSD